MRELLKKTLLAAIGLICFGAGVYLTIQANIGVAPWDALNLGLSKTFGILYGTASVGVSVILILIDLLLKEHIGIGTILDAVLVGKTVDFLNWLDLIPSQENIWAGIVMMLIGFFIMGLSQVIYMKAGLCCGPRDSLLLACSRRIRKMMPRNVSSTAMASHTPGSPMRVARKAATGMRTTQILRKFMLAGTIVSPTPTMAP